MVFYVEDLIYPLKEHQYFLLFKSQLFILRFHFSKESAMVRISKQAEKRSRFPRKHKAPSTKTGSLKDNLPQGFKIQANALEGELAQTVFIPKIK